MADIIIAGFGGQGVLTAGKLLIDVAAREGKNVSWTSSYGAEMRGGTASCSVVISDEEIGSPYPTKLDILIAMNEPSYFKFAEQVRDGGTIIINSSIVSEAIDFPNNINVYSIDATSLANSMNNGRAANIVMLGTMIKATGLLDNAAFSAGLDAYFSKKGKGNPQNLECYKVGYECAKAL